MFSIEDNDINEDRKISFNITDINEFTLEPFSLSPTEAAECSSSQPRLRLLDGTYFKYLPEESTGSKITGICMICPKEVTTKVKGYKNCTSNFLSHLKRKHGNQCVEEYKIYAKKNKIDFKKNPDDTNDAQTSKAQIVNKNKITQYQFDENILKYFIHSMIPLRTVEDPYFTKIFTDLDISEVGLTLMSRSPLRRRIENYYEMEMSSIKSQLNQIEYVCTTTDIWSSEKISFIGVTVHWITHDLRRVSAALACQRFKGVLNYVRLSDVNQKINADFKLNYNKIIASVTNNGSNFVQDFNIFGVKLNNIDVIDDSVLDCQTSEPSSESDVDENDSSYRQVPEYLINFLPLPSHLRCSAHTLTLCATTDANKILCEENTPLSEMHATVIKKCNALWNAAGCPKGAKIIQDVLQHTLSRPNATRWNSLFDALQQIYNIKDKSLLLHTALNMKKTIEENEFEYLKEYLICAAPVAEALNIMQREDNAYYGVVLPCLLALRKKLKEIEAKNNFSFCNSLIRAYKESVEKRFEEMYDLSTPKAEEAAIAALSYPRFKNKWLNCLEPNDRTKILNVFKTCISKQINESNVGETSMASKETTKENRFFNFDSDSDSDMTETKTGLTSSTAPLTKAELLMLHFFAEESQDLQLLNIHPEIKSIFVKYNTPLPSSPAVERLFSFATMSNLPMSRKFSDSMFEKRVVMKYNLKYYKM